MKLVLRRLYRFEAAHRLLSDQLSEEENWATYGKCYRPGGHGHNYEVELHFEGEPDPRSGMLMPRARMDRIVQEQLLDRVDHRNLNDVVDGVTTGEVLALEFARWLQPHFGGRCRLARVVVHETARNRMETTGPLDLPGARGDAPTGATT